MNRLKNKRALVTGGTSGIGLETARQFLEEGARVAVTGTNPDILESARKELGSDVLAIRADAGNSPVSKRSPRPSAASAAWTSCSSTLEWPTSGRSSNGTKPVSTARSRST